MAQKTNRTAGILLHPTSLPGRHGSGSLGKEATLFLEKMQASWLTLWQMLPLNPTGSANSPYQTLSSFAGNTMLVDLDNLAELGLLSKSALDKTDFSTTRADFKKVIPFRTQSLGTAATAFFARQGKPGLQDEYQQFCQEESDWLDDYALYRTLKDAHQGAAWFQWPNPLRTRQTAALAEARIRFADPISREKFNQWLFFRQWRALRKDATQRGIQFIGDIPIYVAHDSADVWAAPELFCLDASGAATKLAGVPPDYFSPTGQLWGNPIYRWDKMAKDNYSWWIKRIRAVLAMVDILRIDHFRGLESYWEIPAGSKTAQTGTWVKGPGKGFFAALRKGLGDKLPIIAEDLGTITPEVNALRTDENIPGMKVLQFAFCDGAEHYLPHMYQPDCVVYTATHDNDTTRGWYQAEGSDYAHMDRYTIDKERDKCRRYLGRDCHDISWDLIRLALQSVAERAIFPMQDIFDLGNDCRMNRPGIADGQWNWRMTNNQLTDMPCDRMRELIALYDRYPLRK